MSARFAAAAFGALSFLFSVDVPGVALAVIPPFAEEWSIPGYPQDVEVDPSGRVWVSCFDDSVRVYTPTGGQLLFTFGGSGTGDGQFNDPFGMAFDPSGDAYICDYANARVEKFAGDGTFLLSWPIPSDRADHVEVDALGDVYVTGFNNQSVHKYDSTGNPILDWTMNSGIRNSGIVVVDGVVSVVGWDGPVVEQFATDGTFLGSFPTDTNGGVDIDIDALGQFWVVDYGNHVVRTFASDGAPIDVFGGFGSAPGEFNFPIGLAVGADGSVYVADESNYRIQRFGPPVSTSAPDGEGGSISTLTAFRSIAPNPCRESVEITYAIGRAQPVVLTVTDISGRTVATLHHGAMSPGEHRVIWGATDDRGRRVPAGVYLARLGHGGVESIARMLVVR